MWIKKKKNVIPSGWHLSGSRPMHIICDFDGTISKVDVTDTLLERFALPGWEVLEEEWQAGRIGSRECMARQVELIRADISEIDRTLEEIEIDPGFPSFVDFCRRNNVVIEVVSDGIDYAIRHVLRRYGLGNLAVTASHLAAREAGRYQLDYPCGHDCCPKGAGICKCYVAEAARQTGIFTNFILLIGDGASDFCVAKTADMTFAKAELLEYCQVNNLPHIPFRDFIQARHLLDAMLRSFSPTAPTVTDLQGVYT